jgi:hypothetical protein
MTGWADIGKEAVRWLVGGGALAVATTAGTWVYQSKQLEIEKQRNLREFLHRYVDLATTGSFDERLRFVQYWGSLDVADQIGVDFEAYHEALRREIAEARAAEHGEGNGAGDEAAAQERDAYWRARASTVAALDPTTASAPEAERVGFDALLARDHDAALAAFRRAEAAWPDYHNVAEIRRLLERTTPESPAAWRDLYDTILTDYVWGMPEDQREAMRAALEG